MARTGRRPGPTETRGQILAAARRLFGENGYDGTTIRGIAAAAGVDPALVHHFFGAKEAVFVAATEFPFDPADLVPAVLDGPRDQVGRRLVGFFLRAWGDAAGRSALLALIRSAVSNERAAAMLREFVTDALMGRLTQHLDVPRLRVELVGAHLVGIAVLRYILEVEPLASAPDDEVIDTVGPVIQQYIIGHGEGARL